MLLPFPRRKAGPAGENSALEPRYTRRISDKMTVAFYAACEIGNLEAAAHLLTALECEVARSVRLGRDKREDGDDLAAVRARLQLERSRHPEQSAGLASDRPPSSRAYAAEPHRSSR